MADAEKVTRGIDAASEMVEQLGKAFNELESLRESSSQNKTQWEDINEHFHNLEQSLKEKLNEVEEKERALKEKQCEARLLLAEREAAVTAKENASLDRLQELKDAAVSAILEARKHCKEPTPVLVDAKGSKDNKVSTSAIDEPNAPISASEENFPDNKSGDTEPVAAKVKPCPQLKEICEQMDAKGILKFISEKRKDLATISEDLSIALKSAINPARLVLDSLEGFYPPDLSNSQGSDETALLNLRRACITVMESAAPLFGMAEPNDDQPVSSEIMQQAKTIAVEWKAKLAGVDINASNGYSLEAAAFLQLLVTFSIAEEFDEDELCKLVLAVSRRRQAPELCRSLGLTHKMPGVVETLVSIGRKIDAVHFAHAFQLTQSFPPVPLLKEYLNDLKKDSQENSGSSAAVDGQKDVNAKELGALRIVIKCIEEYKLQEQYPVEPLKKQVALLEKAKYDKKRQAQAAKTQVKKPRTNGGYFSRKPTVHVDHRQLPPPIYEERGLYPAVAERYADRRYDYTAPPAYEVASHAPYSQQPSAQRSYHYPDERVAPPPYGSSSNYGGYPATGFQSSTPNNYANYMGAGGQPGSTNYGSYMGQGVQSSHQPYM